MHFSTGKPVCSVNFGVTNQGKKYVIALDVLHGQMYFSKQKTWCKYMYFATKNSKNGQKASKPLGGRAPCLGGRACLWASALGILPVD